MGCINSTVDARPNLFERNLCLHHKVPASEVYTVVSEVGRGAYGVVHKVEHKITKDTFAMKTLKCANGMHRCALEKEMNILRGLHHPNIVRMVETYEDEDQFFIIMEICTAGTLLDLVKKRGKELPEDEARDIIRKLALVIMYLHTRFICHRDLKLENVLIEGEELGGELKLSDFGASTFFRSGVAMKQVLGSVVYMAPEVLDGNYKESCDLWSLGVIMYMLLSNHPPFHGANEDELIEKIYEANVDFSDPVWTTISPEAKSLLKKMLDPDPLSRYTAAQVLAHPWTRAGVQPVPDAVYDEIVPRMKVYGHYSPFHRAGLVALAFCLPSSAIRKHSEVYNELNVAHNGFLTLKELTNAPALKRFNLALETIFQALDQQGEGLEGNINLLEFAAATLNVKEVCTDALLRRAYNLFNPGRKDGITHEDLLALLGNHFDTTTCQEMIKRADHDKDGKVAYNDFVKLMHRAQSHRNIPFRRRCTTVAVPTSGVVRSHSSLHIDVNTSEKTTLRTFMRRRSSTPQHSIKHIASEETLVHPAIREPIVQSREEAVRKIQSMSADIQHAQSIREVATAESGESTASLDKIGVVVAVDGAETAAQGPATTPEIAV